MEMVLKGAFPITADIPFFLTIIWTSFNWNMIDKVNDLNFPFLQAIKQSEI